MNRDAMLDRLRDASQQWDVLIIGGGATGVGVAVDAASRGYKTALVEQSDFGKGTSSRSTKLIHGGVRYLEQGNISLVREALHERTLLRQNAPHVVTPLPLVLPTYRWGQRTFYGTGLKVYDWLAGEMKMQRSRWLSKSATVDALPTINQDGLRGGVRYYDGQFDDARLLINLVQTAAEQDAAIANYVRVQRLLKNGDKVTGAVAHDLEGGTEFEIRARVVVNATGAFVDDVRKMDRPGATPIIAPSQGIHVVLDRSFLPGDTALLVPKTRDGRVLFAIPWHGAILAGTTDTPIHDVDLEPRPMEHEIDFVLQTLGDYLTRTPTRDDIRSTFAGIRPLVKHGDAKKTSKLSRDHTIEISDHGLLTITGGKWTTYRHMAEDCVDQAAALAGLERKPSVTKELRVHGFCEDIGALGERWYYGSDAQQVKELAADASLSQKLHEDLPYQMADVAWAARHEMARTVDDILARRTRSLLLNAQAAIDCANAVAATMARVLDRDETWQREQTDAFRSLAANYLP